MEHILNEFYHEVLYTYGEYVIKRQSNTTNGNDLVLAMNAVGRAVHFRENLPLPYFDKVTKKKDYIRDRCYDWYILSEANDAYKHKVRDKKNILVAAKTDIRVIEVITDFQDAEGLYKHYTNEVVVFLVDGSHRDIYDLLTNVINFWQSVLYDLGWVDKPQLIVNQQPGYVPRFRAKLEGYNKTISPRLPLTVESRHQRFNYRTGQIEPYSSTEFQITRTRYELDKNRNLSVYAWVVEPIPGSSIIQSRLTPGPPPEQ